MLVARARLLLVTVWAGSLWTVGYLVAPTLFGTLSDRVLAGVIAGSMFRVEAWVSLGCALGLFAALAVSADLEPKRKRLLALLAAGMLVALAISHLGLQPLMAAAREAGERSRFGMLHGASMGLYLIQSVLALVLVLKNR